MRAFLTYGSTPGQLQRYSHTTKFTCATIQNDIGVPFHGIFECFDSSILTTARRVLSRPRLPVHHLLQHDPVKFLRNRRAATPSVFNRTPDISITSNPQASPHFTVQFPQNTERCASVAGVIDQ